MQHLWFLCLSDNLRKIELRCCSPFAAFYDISLCSAFSTAGTWPQDYHPQSKLTSGERLRQACPSMGNVFLCIHPLPHLLVVYKVLHHAPLREEGEGQDQANWHRKHPVFLQKWGSKIHNILKLQRVGY